MSRATELCRRAELVKLTRHPAPLDYDHTPRNREQRRRLASALRKANKKNR